MGVPGNEEIIEAWRQNLRQWELQRAQYGIDAPVHILNAIEYAKREIKRLEDEEDDGETRQQIVQLAVLQEQVREIRREIRSLSENGRIGRIEQRITWLYVLLSADIVAFVFSLIR